MLTLYPIKVTAAVKWSVITRNPKKWASNTKIELLEEVVKKAKDAYYTSYETLLSDKEYDILEDVLKERKPKSKALTVGAPVKNKTALPFYMGSLDKMKSVDAMMKWAGDVDEFVMSEKLDGVSFLYLKIKGRRKLFTRGDGKFGQDISAFIRHLKLPDPKSEAVRGELIITDTKFKNIWSKHFANARNLVSGVVNSKKLHEAIKDVDAVAFEIIGKAKPSAQLSKLKSMRFKTPAYAVIDQDMFGELPDFLKRRKGKSSYTIDGLVIIKNVSNPVNNSGNPKHAVAFKQNLDTDSVLTEVIRLHWEHSRAGKLIPRVEIKPSKIGGVTVKFITGHNAKFVVDNKIGKGSKLLVIRSGDVIPYIQKVVKKTKPNMPEEEYEWSGVDLIMKDKSDKSAIRTIEHFFSTMGVDGIKLGNITKLFNAGYEDAVTIVFADEDDLVDILGANGRKIFNNIGKMIDSKPSLSKLMDASGIYGNLGERRFDMMLHAVPDVLSIRSKSDLKERLISIGGWGESLANDFIKGLPEMKRFLKYIDIDYTIPKKRKRVGALGKHTVLFSGFRDKELASRIMKAGGDVAKSMTRAVTILLTPSGFSSSKVAKAKERGIPIMTAEQFEKKFL